MARFTSETAKAAQKKSALSKSYNAYVKAFQKFESEGLIFGTSRRDKPVMYTKEEFAQRKQIYQMSGISISSKGTASQSAKGISISSKGLAASQLLTLSNKEIESFWNSLERNYNDIINEQSQLSKDAQNFIIENYEKLKSMNYQSRMAYLRQYGYKLRDEFDDALNLQDFYNS